MHISEIILHLCSSCDRDANKNNPEAFPVFISELIQENYGFAQQHSETHISLDTSDLQ
jgi:hypothetical protein